MEELLLYKGLRLKKGDTIKCIDGSEMEKYVRSLVIEGFDVVADYGKHIIRIDKTPYTEKIIEMQRKKDITISFSLYELTVIYEGLNAIMEDIYSGKDAKELKAKIEKEFMAQSGS